MAAELSCHLLEQMLRHCEQPVAVVDAGRPEAGLRWSNAAFCSLTGFHAAELAERAHPYLSDRDAGQRLSERLQRDPAEIEDDADPSPPFRLSGRRRDGTVALWQIRPVPLRDEAGRCSHWMLQFSEVRSVEPEPSLADLRGRLAAAQREIRLISREDAVTGILGRAWFDDACARQFAVARRQKVAMALMLFEVDCFDAYRETFGAKAGDSCLRLVAHGIAAAMRRATDLVARTGDARFAAAVLELDEAQAAAHAERIREAVERMCIHNPRSTVSRYVTVTPVVVSMVPQADARAEDLMLAAERRLAPDSDGAAYWLKKPSLA